MNAEAADARNWYAPARSAGSPHRCCVVCPRIAADSFELFFHPSASGELNQPGATTFTVKPTDARSSARPLARPTNPAFEAL